MTTELRHGISLQSVCGDYLILTAKRPDVIVQFSWEQLDTYAATQPWTTAVYWRDYEVCTETATDVPEDYIRDKHHDYCRRVASGEFDTYPIVIAARDRLARSKQVCPECGEEFIVCDPRQKYCKTRCQNNHAQKKLRARKRAAK